MKKQNKTKVTKAVILARVATTTQVNGSRSLEDQIKIIEEYCKKEGFEVVGIISEVCSGYNNNLISRLLKFVKSHKDKVVVFCEKLDRLSRNPYDKNMKELNKLIKNKEIELKSLLNTEVKPIISSETFTKKMRHIFTQRNSDFISHNVKRALEQKRQNGEWANKAPFGYLNVKDKNGKSTIIVDKEKKEIIKYVFRLHNKEISLKDILSKLREKYPDSLFKINRGNVYRIIKSMDFYSGYINYDGKKYPHKYERILTIKK
jgi:site-specific DNA recombinase